MLQIPRYPGKVVEKRSRREAVTRRSRNKPRRGADISGGVKINQKIEDAVADRELTLH